MTDEEIQWLVLAIEKLAISEAGEYGYSLSAEDAVAWDLEEFTESLAAYRKAKARRVSE